MSSRRWAAPRCPSTQHCDGRALRLGSASGHLLRLTWHGTQRGDAGWLRVSQELAYLPLHLDLLHGMAGVYHGELEDMELMALDALKANNITKVRSWGASSFHA